MNIIDAPNWRKQCFHCGEELSFYPLISQDIWTKCYVEGRLLHIKNSFLGFTIHLETGEIVIDDSLNGDISRKLIINKPLELQFKCDFCDPDKCYYDYCVHYAANTELSHMEFKNIRETLYHRDKYYIFQYKDINQASISSWSRVAAEAPLGPKPKDIANVSVPYIDLFKLTPDKLEQKIKTYIVFS
jgi:hypothetical protein